MTWKQTFSFRLLYGCWMFSVIVLAIAYSCSFYSMLTLPQFEQLVDTVDDLVLLTETDQPKICLEEYVKSFFAKIDPNSGSLYTLSRYLNR